MKRRMNIMKERNWLMPKLMLVIVAIWFFSTGMMLMDYGATFKDTEVFGQSLIFEKVDMRTVYHSGYVMVLSSFLVICVLCAYELSKY